MVFTYIYKFVRSMTMVNWAFHWYQKSLSNIYVHCAYQIFWKIVHTLNMHSKKIWRKKNIKRRPTLWMIKSQSQQTKKKTDNNITTHRAHTISWFCCWYTQILKILLSILRRYGMCKEIVKPVRKVKLLKTGFSTIFIRHIFTYHCAVYILLLAAVDIMLCLAYSRYNINAVPVLLNIFNFIQHFTHD